MKRFSNVFEEAVRLAISITSSMGQHCNTIDVKAAYLQGNIIEREVYLQPPVDGKLWKLNKSVYDFVMQLELGI